MTELTTNTTSDGRARSKRSERRRRSGRVRSLFEGNGTAWLLAAPVLLLTLLLVVPLAFLVELAVTEKGYSKAMDDPFFVDSVVRTLVMAATVASLTLAVGTFYALAISLAPRWLSIVMVVALFSLFWTSVLVRTYGWMLLYLPKGPLFDILSTFGLRDDPVDVFQTSLAPYPAMVHVMLPYAVLPVWAAVRSLDPDHLRASRVLGAGPWLTLFKVVLPQLRSGIVAGGVLVFVLSLGFYVTPTLLGDPSGLMVASIIGRSFSLPDRLASAAAMSLTLLMVVAFVYMVADRIFRVSEQWGSS